MATYKYSQYISQSQSIAFDSDYSPSTTTPYSGIYRCMGCGREITSEEKNPLPPQNHHQHSYGQGAIKWRMVVYADHNSK